MIYGCVWRLCNDNGKASVEAASPSIGIGRRERDFVRLTCSPPSLFETFSSALTAWRDCLDHFSGVETSNTWLHKWNSIHLGVHQAPFHLANLSIPRPMRWTCETSAYTHLEFVRKMHLTGGGQSASRPCLKMLELILFVVHLLLWHHASTT